MTSKARTRGGNVVQATFLFEKEPNEHMPVASMLEPPKVRTQRASHTKEAAVAQAEAIEMMVVAPEASSTKRRASKSVKSADMNPAAASEVPPSESSMTNSSDQAEPQPVEAKQRRKPRATQPTTVDVATASSKPVEANHSDRVEPEQIQVKESRKRRSARTALVISSSNAEISYVSTPAEVAQPTPPVQLASDDALAQGAQSKQRTPRTRTTVKSKKFGPADDTEKHVAAMPSPEPLAAVEVPTEPLPTGDAPPERKRRKQTAPATSSGEEQALLVETRTRKQRTPVAPEEKVGASIALSGSTGQRELPAGPMFLMSYDDSPKRTLAEKIEAAMMAYQSRFSRRPNLVLVNTNVAPEVEVADVSIERRSTVPPNNFWAGMQPIIRVAVGE